MYHVHMWMKILENSKPWKFKKDTCAINDPLGQTHSPASSDHLKIVLRDFEKSVGRTDGRMDGRTDGRTDA